MRLRVREPRLARALVAAALASAAAGGVRAHDPAAGPPLQLTADPPQLLLGRDAGAEVRVTVPEDAESVAISASVGRVEDVRKIAPSRWAARFVAPAGRVPQVAIVAAVARTPRGAADGWIAIPCSGQADARVRAAPGSEIVLDVAGRRFGPRTTGKDGMAVVPIVVPPGVREAHHGFKPIDLNVPETPLLHAMLDRSAVLADRPERVRVLVWIVAPHGAARRGDAPVLEPTRGSVSVSERQPGEVEAIWTLPPGRAGEERILVRLAGSGVSREVLPLAVLTGPPAVVAVSFDRDAAIAGGVDGVAVTVRALDAGGNPVRAPLAVDADGATLEDVREPEAGVVTARLRVPASLRGRTAAVVRAHVVDAGVSGTRALALIAGPAERATLTPSSGPVRSGVETELTLRVSDAGGNPVSPEPHLAGDRARILGVTPAGAGTWRVRWVAPAVETAGRARIVAIAGGIRAVAEPVLLPPRPDAAIAVAVGGGGDLRGGGWAPSGGAAVDLRAGPARALPLGVELAWRGELQGTRIGDRGGAALLGGGSVSRAFGPTVVVRTSASAGAWLTSGAVAPAARLALDAGLERRGPAPFLEAALLAATGGRDGAFAAFTISAGVRVGVER